MNSSFCPNCNVDLKNNDNVLVTKESSIFKGHNVYMMCKHCGYVVIYNKDRDLMFSLDRFKEDQEVLDEVQQLINEADGSNDLEVVKNEDVSQPLFEEEARPVIAPPEPEPIEEFMNSCSGDCSSCQGCNEQQQKINIKQGDLLIIHKENGECAVIAQDDLQKINVDDFDFFELTPVIVERIVSYRVQRV